MIITSFLFVKLTSLYEIKQCSLLGENKPCLCFGVGDTWYLDYMGSTFPNETGFNAVFAGTVGYSCSRMGYVNEWGTARTSMGKLLPDRDRLCNRIVCGNCSRTFFEFFRWMDAVLTRSSMRSTRYRKSRCYRYLYCGLESYQR